MVSMLLSITSYAQVTTMFYGRNKIQSKNETAALYSVEIYENNTRVTVKKKKKKNRSRMNYWTSRNTYIIVDDNIELPILGFLGERSGEPVVDTDPFSGNWGWSNVKKDTKYYYTMVFAGKIPPGMTNFTLKDKGAYNGAHGYGFSNYELNNPRTGTTSWTEASVKQFADANNDGICGIYEGSGTNGYKLGCIKEGIEYRLLYLGGKERLSWWQIGDTKAVLRNSATTGFFKGDWYMQDKTPNSDCYVVFDGGSMKTIIDNEEEFYLKMYPTSNSNGTNTVAEKWTGTGFALNGEYIVTNYHVVENATSIKVQGVRGDFNKVYNANVVSTDKTNDLAIIKISDQNFNGFGNIPYKVKTSLSEVGEDVFVLGYPLTSTMGDEIKLTTGVISSKTGFQGDISLYQISAPIQPGNSGGPVFDGKGNLIGIVNAKHRGAENVSYAIKSSYLGNLIESATYVSVLPSNNTISTMSLSNKVKNIRDFVFMITCSNGQQATAMSSQNDIVISYPSVSSNTLNDSQHYTSTLISKVTVGNYATIIELTLKNYVWCSINPGTYIYANGQKYTLQRSEGIATEPQKTYPSYRGADIVCRLYFPPIPKSTNSFDLIESQSSRWKFYGVKLR